MAEHIFEAGLPKTTGASAVPIAVIVPAALAAGVRMPEIREIGIFNQSGVAAEVGLGIPAAAGVTPTTHQLVANMADGNGRTDLVTVHTTPATAPTSFFRRAELQAVVGAGIMWTWPAGFALWSGAAVPQLVLWQISAVAVTYDIYVSVAE